MTTNRTNGVRYNRRTKRKIIRFYNNLKETSTYIAAGIVFVMLIAFIYSAINSKKIKIDITDVAAMRVPYSTANTLHSLSERYDLPFAELLAIYAVDNFFFATKMAARNESEILQQYIMGYNTKIKEYGEKKLQPYVDLFSVLMTEIEYFPVADEHGDYMYGDSFGAIWLDGKHNGADIIDRESRNGRLEVVNMVTGKVESYGLDPEDGYFVGIRADSGNYYYYAHFDSISPKIEKGKHIDAGEVLGLMGSTGKGETSYGYPVRVHLGIKVKTDLAKNDIWINPYIFLRIVENLPINN